MVLYDMIEQFNLDWNAQCGQLNVAYVTGNKK